MGLCLPAVVEFTLSSLAAAVQPNEEQALARAAAGGDRAAFCALVRRTQRAVFGLCYRLLRERDGAADAAQETFARAYASLASFDPQQRFEVWVLRIARNHCFDLLRRRGLAAVEEDEALEGVADGAPSVEERLQEAEATRHLETAMEGLPASDREVLALYYVQHRTTRDIAQVLGVAPGTVMARLFRARARLRQALERYQA